MPSKVSEIKEGLKSYSDWDISAKKITKVFLFADFKSGMVFLNKVAKEAEAMKHHPDINIRYNKIKITLSTHSEGGVTPKDIKLAKKIESLSPKISKPKGK